MLPGVGKRIFLGLLGAAPSPVALPAKSCLTPAMRAWPFLSQGLHHWLPGDPAQVQVWLRLIFTSCFSLWPDWGLLAPRCFTGPRLHAPPWPQQGLIPTPNLGLLGVAGAPGHVENYGAASSQRLLEVPRGQRNGFQVASMGTSGRSQMTPYWFAFPLPYGHVWWLWGDVWLPWLTLFRGS